jgi:hypothetical protein
MRPALRVVLLSIAVALATVALGWWGVVVVGGLWGLIGGGRRAGLRAALAAVIGWSGMLLWMASQGPVWRVAERVGPIFALPAPGFLMVTLLFGALSAGSAAALAGRLRRDGSRDGARP